MVKQIGRGDLTLIDFNDVTASFTAPSNPSEGAMWFNKNDNQLYVYETNGWTLSTKGMEFGGRNLLRNSGKFKDLTGWLNYSSSTPVTDIALIEDSTYGKVITATAVTSGSARLKLGGYISMEKKDRRLIFSMVYSQTGTEDITLGGKYSIYSDGGGEYSTWSASDYTYEDLGNGFKKMTCMVNLTYTVGYDGFFPYVYVRTNTIRIAHCKLEEGNIATDWTPAPEDVDDVFEDIMETLGNMANDNVLNYEERKVIKDTLTEVTGVVTADTTTSIPTTSVLDASKKGEFYSIRKSATNAGIETTDVAYIDVATKYNTLRTYLSAMVPRPWDLSVANQDANISVVKNTFRTNWGNYYTAVQTLATATVEKLKKNIDDITVGGANVARNGNFGIMLADSAWKDSYIGGIKEIVDISTQTPPFQYALHINNTVNGNGGIFNPVLWEGATAEALVDKEVTISYWTKYQNIAQGLAATNLAVFGGLVIEGLTSASAKVYNFPRVNNLNQTSDLYTFTGSDMVWKKHVVTHKLSLPATATKLSKISFKHGLDGCRGEFWMTGLQIEMGNKVTEWKYSDEDMNQRVTNAEFKVSDSQIISSVTSSQAWTLETAKIKNSTDSIADMMSDLKITPIEKSSLKTLWDEMQAKYTQILALANTASIAVSATALTAAYTAMNTTAPRIQTDILANMTTTYTLTAATRDAFKAQVNTFYVEAEKLNKAISDKINSVANDAKAVVTDIMSDLKITPVEKAELQRTWQKIQAQYTELNAQAITLGVASATRTNFTAAYNALNTTTPRIQTDILASMSTNYTLTTATRDTFKAQLNTYFTQAEIISRANTDSIQSYASRIEQKADGIVTTVTGINSRLGEAESKITQTSEMISSKVSKVENLGGRQAVYSNVHSHYNPLSNVTGYWVIETTIPKAAIMVDLNLKGYNYVSKSNHLDVAIGFYSYSADSFLQHGFVSKGSKDVSEVRLANKDGKAVIIVGKITDKWSYPSLNVESMTCSYAVPKDEWGTGWTSTITTDLTPYTGVQSIGAKVMADTEEVGALASRVSTAEQKITPEGIVGTVTSSTTWTTQKLAIGTAQDTANTAKNNAATAQNAADTVQGKLDNLQIGGRNLALGTSNKWLTINSAGWGSYPYGYIDTKEGQEHTASVYVRAGLASVGIRFIYKKADGTTTEGNTVEFIEPNKEGLLINTHTTPVGATSLTVQFRHTTRDTAANIITYTEYKIEKGSKRTDWTPAVEDVDSLIATAQKDASDAKLVLTDIMSDLKITPVEKSTLKLTWDEIQAKHTQMTGLASSLGVSSSTYTTAYNALNSTAPRIQIDILASMTATYTLTTTTRDAFKAQMNTYFVEAEKLGKALSDKIQANANAAQVSANTANQAITDMSSDGVITPVEKVQLQKEWAVIKAEKISLDGTATTFGITTEKTNLNTAYTTLNTVLTGIFTNMKANSTVTATTFRGQFDDFYDKKAILQRKVSETARGLSMSGIGQGQITTNPIFADWTSTYPKGFSLWNLGTGFSKETTLSKNGGYGARFKVTTASTQIGMTIGSDATINSQKEPDFVVVEVDYMLVTGSIGGAGILLDWGGLANNRQSISLSNENPAPTLNKWYTVRRLVPKPSGTTGTFTTMAGYVMANYSSGLGTLSIKDLIIDRFSLREPTEEEIKAYNSDIMIADMSSDSKITPVEKVQLKKEWETIKAERTSVDGAASTFGITTERTNMTNSYNALNNVLNTATTGILADMKATTTVVATTFRATFDDYYDKKAILQRKISETARGLANQAQTDANTANGIISDISSDLKITPVEKSTLKTTWDEIQAKNTSIMALATSLGVSTSTYAPTFTALNTTAPRIQTDILASMATTYTLTTATRDNLKAQMNTYYVQYEALSKAVSEKINGNAGAAQSGVNDLISDLKITPLEKSELSRTWEIIKAQYTELNAQALSLGVLSTLRTAYTTAYNALNSTAPRIQTDVLASMTSTYTLTTATRDTFKAQMTTYQQKAQEISKAITDKLDANTKSVKSDVDAVVASTGNLVNNPAVSGNATGWTGGTLGTQTFEGVATQVVENTSTSSATIYSNYFDVDPSKGYEVSMWIKKTQPAPSSTNLYIGTSQLNGAGASSPVTPISNATGTIGTDSTNFYFFNRGGVTNFANWEKITAYILPTGYDPTLAKGISNATSHAMMKSDTRKMRIRMLNYNNTTTEPNTTWFAHPKVVEVPTEVISRVSSSESKISQLADDITLKVSKTDYTGNTITSMINQTATTIKLKAENIELMGITTVANELNIGTNFRDTTPKYLRFYGANGGTNIQSRGNDDISVIAPSWAEIYGGYDTYLGGTTLGGATYRAHLNAQDEVNIKTTSNTLRMHKDSKAITLNGHVIGIGENALLWSGALFMSETHTVTPTKKLSECPNGWVLLWSRYVNSAPANSDWNTTIIPKEYPTLAGASGMWCPLVAANVSADTPPMAYKYVYPNNTRVLGHERNKSGTESGQVLRAILSY